MIRRVAALLHFWVENKWRGSKLINLSSGSRYQKQDFEVRTCRSEAGRKHPNPARLQIFFLYDGSLWVGPRITHLSGSWRYGSVGMKALKDIAKLTLALLSGWESMVLKSRKLVAGLDVSFSFWGREVIKREPWILGFLAVEILKKSRNKHRYHSELLSRLLSCHPFSSKAYEFKLLSSFILKVSTFARFMRDLETPYANTLMSKDPQVDPINDV